MPGSVMVLRVDFAMEGSFGRADPGDRRRRIEHSRRGEAAGNEDPHLVLGRVGDVHVAGTVIDREMVEGRVPRAAVRPFAELGERRGFAAVIGADAMAWR